MFKIPDGQEVTDFGFAVYHTDTGERVKPTDLFLLSEKGGLYEADLHYGGRNIKKEGKYIIQFSDGRYMRY